MMAPPAYHWTWQAVLVLDLVVLTLAFLALVVLRVAHSCRGNLHTTRRAGRPMGSVRVRLMRSLASQSTT